MKEIIRFAGYLIPVCLLVGSAFAEVTLKDDFSKTYSPYANTNYPLNVYWGDTHLHTNMSIDGGGDPYNPMGKGLSRRDAYLFAKGQPVVAHNGMKFRLQRPLDFLVIADHAENIGVHQGVIANDPVLMKSEEGRLLRAKYESASGDPKKLAELYKQIQREHGLEGSIAGGDAFRSSVWKEVTASADEHNDPGNFTAFIGYEWTSHDFWLHRVVILKDDAEQARRFLPYSQFDSKNPEDLWAYLFRYARETGGDAFAIPHNGNLSEGMMFRPEDSKGRPFDKFYAQTRSRWEPLYEVTQIKGDSEAHPFLSPSDEFADFETWLSVNEKKPENSYRKYEYARSALKIGLDQQAKLGINPFKFGMIGSSDSHNALSSVAENNFIGKGAWSEPSPERLTMVRSWGEKARPIHDRAFSASGYAAVWAMENTREALFAAMKRKETYATTGPRMAVRFFGGWAYQADDALKPDLVKIGYDKGVPMGGDLINAPKGQSPRFLIRAVKDPDGANLDRVQVIKGWHDKNGELHEKVYNIALSDNRKENWRGKVKSVGSTVDIKEASYTNNIGDPELSVVWTDPDFDKNELAFYYVRVLEIPTPRWTAFDAKFFGLDNVPDKTRMVIQERAYTTPIWYTP